MWMCHPCGHSGPGWMHPEHPELVAGSPALATLGGGLRGPLQPLLWVYDTHKSLKQSHLFWNRCFLLSVTAWHKLCMHKMVCTYVLISGFGGHLRCVNCLLCSISCARKYYLYFRILVGSGLLAFLFSSFFPVTFNVWCLNSSSGGENNT